MVVFHVDFGRTFLGLVNRDTHEVWLSLIHSQRECQVEFKKVLPITSPDALPLSYRRLVGAEPFNQGHGSQNNSTITDILS